MPRRLPHRLLLGAAVALMALGVHAAVTTEHKPIPAVTFGMTTPVGPDMRGKPATTDPFPELDGGSGSLAAYRGRPLVINIFSSSCASCAKEMPAFEAVHRASGDAVAFLGIDVYDIDADARALVARTKVTYDIGSDPEGRLAFALGTVLMPTTMLVSPTGEIRLVHAGPLTATRLRSLLRANFPA